jgi:hypothetical protein
MLPRLQAEDQLRRIDAATLGGGNVKPRDARRAIRDLTRIAEGGRRRATKATPAMLAAAGIAVVTQPAPDTGAGTDTGAEGGDV